MKEEFKLVELQHGTEEKYDINFSNEEEASKVLLVHASFAL